MMGNLASGERRQGLAMGLPQDENPAWCTACCHMFHSGKACRTRAALPAGWDPCHCSVFSVEDGRSC